MKMDGWKKVVISLCLGSFLYGGVHGEWGYSGDVSPEKWGEIKPEFFMCKEGKNQSPIDINDQDIVLASGLEELKFHYTSDATTAINNGHTIKVDVADGSYIEVDGIRFKFIQFHFHSPSENTINGKYFPFEAHFVHQSEDGQLAVLAIMYEEGKENKILKKVCSTIFSAIDKVHQCKLKADDINTLLPESKNYYRFSGSLTTPPCSEGVRWLVLKEHREISAGQIEKFINVMMKGRNNRPVQPLDARKVMKNR